MQKRSLKPIILSTLLATSFGATTVGTTFALFTDRADTKIEVTAGAVDLDVEFSDLKLYSAQESDDTTKDLFEDENHATYYHKEMESEFANNGTVTLKADGGISVVRMTPGDKFTYKISSENKSNVKTKFRLNFEAIDDDDTLALVDEIIIKAVSGTTEFVLSNYLDFKTDWVELDALETPYEEMVISVELPMTTGNAYQNLSGHFKLTEEIVQGNAHVVNEQPVEVVRTSAALASLEEGATAKLATGEYKMPATVADGVTIVGGEGVVINTAEKNVVGGEEITFEKVVFDGERENSAVLDVKKDSDVEFKDCEFTGGKYSTWDSCVHVNGGAEVVFDNVVIDNAAFRGVLVQGENTELIIKNSDIDAVYPINCDGGSGTILVQNSKFHGWTSYDTSWTATFENTEFTKKKSGYNNVAAYNDTYFKGCTFGSDFKTYNQTPGFNWVFDANCTKGGVAVTAANYKVLFPEDPDVWNKSTLIVDGVFVAAD